MKISKDRLIPPVESSGSSSSRGIAEARLHPQIPPTRLNFLHQYFETDPKRLRLFITFGLDASATMENAFFASFSPRLELDVAHLRRRRQLHVPLDRVRR